MSITPKGLVNAQYVPGSTTLMFTAISGGRTIIDKLTATNATAGAVTFTLYIVEAGGTPGPQHTIVSAVSIAANTALDVTVAQNHILNANDKIYAAAGAGSSIVLRMSGREVT